MDLSPLQIDRQGQSAPRRKGRGRGGFPWGRLLLLAVALGLAFLFREPLLRKVDSLRLQAVATEQVYRPDLRAATAAQGTSANGYVIAKTRAALSADTPGRIVELNVEEGSVVKAGDVVARLYSEELEAALAGAEAEVLVARAGVASAQAGVQAAQAALPDLEAQVQVAEGRVASAEASIDSARAVAQLAVRERERAQSLLASQAGTQERLDRAKSEEQRTAAELVRSMRDLTTFQASVGAARAALESARAQVASAEAAVDEAQALVPVREAQRNQVAATLSKTAVVAPFDGVVVLKDAEVGEVVSPNSQGASSRGSVATMVDFSSLEVQVELPETSIAAVEPGAPAQVFLDAYPSRAYAGRVDRIWPTANRQKGTIEVRVAFEQPDQDLRPEMGARVTFGAVAPAPEQEDVGPLPLRVSASSVLRDGGRTSVLVLERDTVRRVEVELGEAVGAQVEVLSGLEEGQLVVASPPSGLDDGDRVRTP